MARGRKSGTKTYNSQTHKVIKIKKTGRSGMGSGF